MKGPKDLEKFIKEKGINAEIVGGGDFSTSSKAASTLSVYPSNILKTILLICDNKPLIVYLRGNRRISFSKLKKLGFNKIRLANEKEIVSLLGYPRGGVPPIDLPKEIPKILDKDIAGDKVVYAGGGDLDKGLKITVEEIIKEASPIIEDISEPI